jgi:hypothetical protein
VALATALRRERVEDLLRDKTRKPGKPPIAAEATAPAINAYLAEHNASPKPFVWTKSAEVMLTKLDRLPVTSL